MDRVWLFLSVLLLLAGVRYLWRLHSTRRSARGGVVDDAAIREIMETGRLSRGPDRPLDMRRAAEAEEQFWSESWDEPEEFPR